MYVAYGFGIEKDEIAHVQNLIFVTPTSSYKNLSNVLYMNHDFFSVMKKTSFWVFIFQVTEENTS